jgi:hypothetical protein
MVMCAAVIVKVCYMERCGREMVMCAAVSVMFFYKAGERKGNGDVWCNYRKCLLHGGVCEGNGVLCCS